MATSRICSIPDCGKPVLARNWCSRHYDRWRASGDPLRGGTTPGEPLRFFKDIALVYDKDDCLVWPFGTTRGYGNLFFDGKTRYVHRLVCEHVHGAPSTETHGAAHKCGNRACVNPRHLSWKTPKANKADELLHGTRSRGERHPRAKLTIRDVKQIRALRGELLQREIAERFGIGRQMVANIQLRKAWAWL